jgi:hypothetical protein
MPNDLQRGCLGVFREHDGTVYSIDAFWKYGNQVNQKPNNKRISPERGSSKTVTVVSGFSI